MSSRPSPIRRRAPSGATSICRTFPSSRFRTPAPSHARDYSRRARTFGIARGRGRRGARRGPLLPELGSGDGNRDRPHQRAVSSVPDADSRVVYAAALTAAAPRSAGNPPLADAVFGVIESRESRVESREELTIDDCRLTEEPNHQSSIFNLQSSQLSTLNYPRSAPAASQGLDEVDGGGHAPDLDVDGHALVVQSDSLSGDDLEVRRRAGEVAVSRDRERPLGRGYRLGLLGRFFRQDAQRREVVLDLLE